MELEPRKSDLEPESKPLSLYGSFRILGTLFWGPYNKVPTI